MVQKKKGQITIQFETGQSARRSIELFNAGHLEKIAVDDINYYTVGENRYYPKIVDIDLNGSQMLLFLKQLSVQNSRIGLYELYQQKSQANDGVDKYFYFISLSTYGRLEVLSIASKTLVPNFDQKVSKLVEDCPALAEKIRQKEKGYYLPALVLSDQRKATVYLTIINEYNGCH
jgi:hypothetical protein